MKGEIGSSSFDNFNSIIRDYPDVNTVRIIDCDGSVDDETCFLLMKRLHDLGINTHIEDDGWVASGGVVSHYMMGGISEEWVFNYGWLLGIYHLFLIGIPVCIAVRYLILIYCARPD